MIEIPLTQGKAALIDDADFDLVKSYGWCVDRRYKGSCYYVVTGSRQNGEYHKVYMHRLIMSPSEGQDVDHINNNGLDNRRVNLRICTRTENLRNSRSKGGSSKYKGVSWIKRRKKWQAQIMCNRRHFHIGYYSDDKCAADAYNESAKKLFGTFAKLNKVA